MCDPAGDCCVEPTDSGQGAPPPEDSAPPPPVAARAARTARELAAAVAAIRGLWRELLAVVRVDALVVGSLPAAAAREIAALVESTLIEGAAPATTPTPLEEGEGASDRALRLAPAAALTLGAPDPNDRMAAAGSSSSSAGKSGSNSAVVRWLPLGPGSGSGCPRRAAVALMLGELVRQPFNAQLRTREQLGYVVRCACTTYRGIVGLRFHLMSATHGPRHLLQRAEAFLSGENGTAGFGPELRALPHEVVARYASALRRQLLAPPRSIAEVAGALWGEAEDRSYRWGRVADIAAELPTVTAGELADVFDALVAPGGAPAGSLTVWLRGCDHDEAGGEGPSPVIADHSFSEWQRTSGSTFYAGVNSRGQVLPSGVLGGGARAAHGTNALDLPQPKFVRAAAQARRTVACCTALLGLWCALQSH